MMLRSIWLFSILFAFNSVKAQEINWVSLEQAVALQKKTAQEDYHGHVHRLVRSM